MSDSRKPQLLSPDALVSAKHASECTPNYPGYVLNDSQTVPVPVKAAQHYELSSHSDPKDCRGDTRKEKKRNKGEKRRKDNRREGLNLNETNERVTFLYNLKPNEGDNKNKLGLFFPYFHTRTRDRDSRRGRERKVGVIIGWVGGKRSAFEMES